MKCRAITTKNVLCKKTTLQGKSYCSCHQKKIVEGVQKFTKISDKKEISFSVLPDDILQVIYLNYFKAHVLPEIGKYDPQGDFSNTVDKLCFYNNKYKNEKWWDDTYVTYQKKWLVTITHAYRYICQHDLWDCFRRNHLSIDYTLYGVGIKMEKIRKLVRNIYYYDSYDLIINDMLIFEYIANNGWFKFIMP